MYDKYYRILILNTNNNTQCLCFQDVDSPLVFKTISPSKKKQDMNSVFHLVASFLVLTELSLTSLCLCCFCLFQELDGLEVGRRSVQMDRETLMERLDASKRVTEAARRESNCLEKQVEELERKLQSSQRETQAAGDKLHMFLRKVAGLLQAKSENVIMPTEKDVSQTLDKVRDQWGFLSHHSGRVIFLKSKKLLTNDNFTMRPKHVLSFDKHEHLCFCCADDV